MAKNRYINTEFWRDEYIENLDCLERYLFLYCLTNPLTNIAGCYKISSKRMSFETGLEKDMVIKLLGRFEIDKKVKYFDGWIGIKNFIKHQSINPKIKKGIETELKKVPKELLAWLTEKVDKNNIAYDSLSKALNYINPNLNINTNTNAEIIDKIYNLYPTKCPNSGRSISKSHKDKDRIKNMLKIFTPYRLERTIEKYIEDSKNNEGFKASLKDFSTLLNNLPDYDLPDKPIDLKDYGW